MVSVSSHVKFLLHPYYFFNIFLSLSFFLSRYIQPVCHFFFGKDAECELSLWESEALIVMIIIVMFKSKRSGSRSLYTYINTCCLYAKGFNTILWFRVDPIKGLVFLICIVLHFLIIGEPIEDIQSNVLYFDSTGLTDELKKDKNTYWMVAYYTSWSPSCTKLAPVFSKLSSTYGLSNFKFGKLDVGRYPELAKKYHINDTAFSVQLPTIALYKGEEQLMRRPNLDSNGKLQKFYFTIDNIIAAYDLNNIYQVCKDNLMSKDGQARLKAE